MTTPQEKTVGTSVAALLLAAAMITLAAGCSASIPFVGPRAKQEELRKAVEADAFPTASQAGL